MDEKSETERLRVVDRNGRLGWTIGEAWLDAMAEPTWNVVLDDGETVEVYDDDLTVVD